MLLWLKAVKLCVGVFHSDGEIQRESKDIAEIRTIAREVFFDTQAPISSFCFRSLWMFLMLLVAVGGAAWPMLLLPKVSEQLWYFSIVVTVINGLFVLMWIILLILNFTRHRPSNSKLIRRNKDSFSYFAVEQIQQCLSELSLYPQLCFAAMKLDFLNISYPLLGIFSLCVLLLVVLLGLRLRTAAKIKKFIKSFSRYLIFSLVSNHLSVLFLIAILAKTVPNKDFPLQLALFGLVLITNIWNLFMSYLSHMYEITLQSGVNVVQVSNAIEGRNIVTILQKLLTLEPFHKTMYSMSLPGSGTLLYFWIIPSTAVTIYTVVAYLDNLSVLIPVVVWFFFNAATNYRSFLQSCSAQLASVVILLVVVLVVSVSLAIMAFFFYILLIALVLLIAAAVLACVAWFTGTAEKQYNSEHAVKQRQDAWNDLLAKDHERRMMHGR